MDSSKQIKRKKFKTRKCLDKLRNNCNMLKNKEVTNYGKITENFTCRKKMQNNFLSSNRISLKLFPKAVRSETITRPLLENLRQESNTIKHKKCETQNFADVAIKSNVSVYKNIDEKRDTSSDELLIFSPLSDRPISSRNEGLELSVKKTADVNTSNEFYEDIMNGVSLYVKNKLSNLFNEDVMGNYLKRLQEIYFEKCHKEYNSVQKCLKGRVSTYRPLIPNMLLENPKNDIQPVPKSQYSESEDETYSMDIHSPATCLRTAVKPVMLDNINIYKTPEYIYYPHKLK